MKHISILLALILLNSCKDVFDTTPLAQSGVPLVLANYRAEQLSNVRYDLSFTIPEKKETPIESAVGIDFILTHLDAPLILDFKEDSKTLTSLVVNGKSEEITPTNEHLIIPVSSLTEGPNHIEVNFKMGELSLNRNDEYLYTLLVPDRARTLFPCFDQPNIKAQYTLTITAPIDWRVLCGAPIRKVTENAHSRTHSFEQTDKMSTYLFSFVAGTFQKASESPEGFTMNLLYRENDSTKIALSTPVIFDLHHQSVQFLEQYTTLDFPFQKLDYATIPGFQYGGMEHVGAIQYREESLFLDESATTNRRLSRAKLIAHETAHMWFGDLVTMNWFNDVWMKEVFANFMADKIVNPAFPEINHDLAFMVAHYPSAYNEDRTLGTNPIRQPLENLNNAGSLYGSIIYNKAPIVMRQLENAIGKEAFQKGIQRYLKKYAYGNAVWNDLVMILDEETKMDVKEWSEIWVNRSSRPIFEEQITYTSDNTIDTFIISQTAEDKSDGIWPQTFEITLIYQDTAIIVQANISEKTTVLSELKGLKKPAAIRYNSNSLGYGIFPLEDAFLKRIPTIQDPVSRAYAYINVYENTLNGTLSGTVAYQLYAKGLSTEKNELVLNLISGYLSSIFWKYLPVDQRDYYQKKLATQLLAQLKSDAPSNIKKTLFKRFCSIAYSEASTKALYKIWSKEMNIPNLKLNQDDYTAMAMNLALFGHSESSEILELAKKEITNPDKVERFEFIYPALSADQHSRDTFFESLKIAENRAKESWTLSALNYLNHPLRSEMSIRYLPSSLALLDEIQKTGDIFFPKGWLNSTIGNFTSEEAFSILEEFIESNPDLNPALLKKVLQASDDLRRIQLLHKKVNKQGN